MTAILKGNADLVPAQSALYIRHPIVLPDGRVPCDVCAAAITIAEAERHVDAWMQHVCDRCAGAPVPPAALRWGAE